MQVSDFSSNSERKLQQIVAMLASMYDVRVDWNQDEATLREAYSSYEQLKKDALYESSSQSRDYTRMVLITEALRIYLYEIAPKRRKTPRRKK